jgi:hypothetical protein
MKTSSTIILLGFLSLSVSCAHKKTATEETLNVETKAEKVTEVKKEDKNLLVYTCLVGKDKRTVTLDKHEKRCEVQYTKFGDEQKVAWAESTPAICDRVFNTIRTNIEGSGYQCNEGLEIKTDKKEEVKKPVETAAK